MSAVMVHDSHAYKNMDMARESSSLILELMAMLLSFCMSTQDTLHFAKDQLLWLVE